jgi:hypothetical protein
MAGIKKQGAENYHNPLNNLVLRLSPNVLNAVELIQRRNVVLQIYIQYFLQR